MARQRYPVALETQAPLGDPGLEPDSPRFLGHLAAQPAPKLFPGHAAEKRLLLVEPGQPRLDAARQTVPRLAVEPQTRRLHETARFAEAPDLAIDLPVGHPQLGRERGKVPSCGAGPPDSHHDGLGRIGAGRTECGQCSALAMRGTRIDHDAAADRVDGSRTPENEVVAGQHQGLLGETQLDVKLPVVGRVEHAHPDVALARSVVEAEPPALAELIRSLAQQAHAPQDPARRLQRPRVRQGRAAGQLRAIDALDVDRGSLTRPCLADLVVMDLQAADAAAEPLVPGDTALLPASLGEVPLAPHGPTVLLDAYLP